MKKIAVKQTFVDRMVGYFNPVAGQKRFQARVMMALSGGYIGGRRSKKRRSMSSWMTSGNDADSDILPDLPALRENSRDLIRNNPIGGAVVNTKVTNVVGTGLVMHPQIDADLLGMTEEEADAWEANTEREWRLFADSEACDWENTCCFSEQQDLVFRSTLENGDVFALLPFDKRPGNVYGLKVQIIEADRVSNPDFKRDTATIAGGIEKTETGVPIKAYIQDQHPGSLNRKSTKWTEREFYSESGRRNLLHIYRKLRPGQTRGVPDLAPAIEAIKQLGDYTEAEITAAVVSGMFTAFVTTESGDGLAPMDPVSETGGKSTDKDYKMGSGAILDLMPGEKVEFANPGRPNTAFEAFVVATTRFIGAQLELPFELLVKHFTASYSASRAALLEAWKYFDARRMWLVQRFCQPVYEKWLEEAVASGRVSAPGFLNGDPAIKAAYCGAEWVGPARGHIQPYQEAQALGEHLNMGTKTLQRATAETDGGRWDRNHRQRAKEVKKRREDGLDTESTSVSQDPPDKIDQPGNDE